MTDHSEHKDPAQELAEKDRPCRELSQRLKTLQSNEYVVSCFAHLLDAIAEGFGLAEIIRDHEGRPVDFRLMQINRIFARLLDIPPHGFQGMSLRQANLSLDASWTDRLCEIAASQQPTRFKVYFEGYEAWYTVQAFCPRPDLLALLLTDNNEETRKRQEIEPKQLFPSLGQIPTYAEARESSGEPGQHEAFQEFTGERAQEGGKRQHKLIRGINRIFSAVVNSADDKEFGTTCLSVVEDLSESAISFLGELGPEGHLQDIAVSNPTWEECSLAAQHNPGKRPVLPHLHGLYSSVFTLGTGIFTNDPAAHPDSRGVPQGHPPLRCFMAAPLKNGAKTTGMIAVANRQGEYTEEDLAALETLAHVVSESLSRRRAERAIIAGEDRYRSLFMSSPDAIFVNQDDRITLVNEACIRLYGAQAAEDLLGKSPYELYHPEYHALIRKRIESIRERNESLPPYEAKIVRLDGRPVHVEVNSAGFLFGNSRAIHVILRDITESRQAAEDLKRSNRELEQFAYSISHDLQEPLRSITGFLQLFQARYHENVDEKGQFYIQRTLAGCLRMKRLIKDMLSLSRISAKKGRFVPTDLNDVLAVVMDSLDSTVSEKGAEVICHNLPCLPVDATQIQLLLQNLLVNAIKYNTSKIPKVEIGHNQAIDYHEFYVKDNGIGILPEFHERIFVPFQRLHTPQEYEGSGIGLSLCKKIVECHQGRIWVESALRQGTTFYFTLSANLGRRR